MRSHETRPSSVPPKLEIWGDSQHCCPPVKTLEGTVPLCSPMIYATDVKVDKISIIIYVNILEIIVILQPLEKFIVFRINEVETIHSKIR